MAFLLAIIILSVTFFTLDSVVPGSQRRIFPVLLFLLILLLLFLMCRLDGLIGVGRSRGLAIGLLCFLGPGFLSAGFLGSGFLGLYF